MRAIGSATPPGGTGTMIVTGREGWLDKEQADRLQQGKYFATITRQRESCWIRGALSGADDGKEDSVFFMDSANPKPDGPDAGSFYNKAPRFSVFQGDAYECEAIK